MSKPKLKDKKLSSYLSVSWLLLETSELVLKYTGQARAGLLLKWEKEREKRYRIRK